MKKLYNYMYNLLHSHEIVKMPNDMEHLKNVILTTTICSTIIFDILTFAIKGAQSALSAGLNWLALGLMIIYFIRQVLKSTVHTFTDTQKNHFSEQSDSYITANVSQISNIVRGKVFKEKDEYSLIMTNSEVIFNLKEFINYIWTFWQNFPIVVANSIMAIVMSVAILVTEFIQTGDLKLTLVFSGILFACILLFGILFKLRLTVRKSFRENHRKLRKENEVLMNDVKNIEPLIQNEFTYRVKLLIQNLKNKRNLEKKEVLKLNGLYILRTLVLAIFMVLIIIIKLYQADGINNLSIAVLTDIIAISTVYSNILDKVAAILTDFETITNTIRDAEKVKSDVDNIMKVYEQECSIEFANNNFINKITVEQFEFSYPSAIPGEMSVYKLRNYTPFELETGNSYLVYGHTGCGKSTLMHLLIGKLLMAISPISYGNVSERAYLSSIMHESNGKLGSNPVLQELIFSNDISEIDRERMIEVLHGTHIYEDVMRNLGLTFPNDDKILEYLNSTTIEQYSSGQRQRLSIVKVLYNLNHQHQIVVFDEATNALDDSTALSVLKFMANYCQKDRERIVLFVSHQVDLTKEITDGSITFESKTFPVFDIVTEL